MSRKPQTEIELMEMISQIHSIAIQAEIRGKLISPQLILNIINHRRGIFTSAEAINTRDPSV